MIRRSIRKTLLFPLLAFSLLFSFSSISPAQDSDGQQDTGRASYYGDDFHGLETSSGETFNQNDFTAAHRTLPFNTILHVTNKENGKSVIVRVNDRGPFNKSRVIDLSHSAAKKINMVPFGVVPVKIQVLTLLDLIPFNDSLFRDEETWDCYGNRVSLAGNTICVWTTSFWKHAFYMASHLSLDEKLERVTVHVTTPGNRKMYSVMITGLASKNKSNELVSHLQQEGFMSARIFPLK